MNRIAAAVNLCITVFYLGNIITHMISPGPDTGYTRMLMFACIATIPLAFMMAIVGGRDRLPLFAARAREMVHEGFSSVILLIGLAVLLVIMPLGMLAGVWFGMGLRFGSMFVLFFVPVLVRLALAPARVSVQTAVRQVVILFSSFFIGIAIVAVLDGFGQSAGEYERHLQIIWPGYGDADRMFFSVCIFALLNQLAEFGYALKFLLGKKQAGNPA